MSELSESLEKSIEFLKDRYPADHPLIIDLEQNLKELKSEGTPLSTETSSMKGDY